MEFRKRHKKLYFCWVALSVLIVISMVVFLVSPLLY